MADRNWAKELAKIDKQMQGVSDDESDAKALAPAAQAGGPEPLERTHAGPTPADGSPAKPPRATMAFGVFARLTLSVVLGIAILLWPYQARCGFGLAAYLAAVLVVAVSGGWSAIWTWRHHAARAHVLSLLLLLWGLLLGGLEVLPRVGYAKPDLGHPAIWLCR